MLADGLTADQLDTYREDGFLVLQGVLTDEEVAAYGRAVDVTIDEHRDEARDDTNEAKGERQTLRLKQLFERTDAFDRLIDAPKLLAPLISLMGPWIQVLGMELFVRFPSEGGQRDSKPLVEFHTDGGPALQQVLLDPRSRAIQLKAQVFLTDVSAPDSGNFMCVRGSHRLLPEPRVPCFVEEANRYVRRGTRPPETVEICARPGDALVFPPGLWHAVGPNNAGRSRKSVIIRYGQLWCRPYDYVEVPRAVRERMSARRRRMLGDLGPGAGATAYYKPKDQEDVMLEGLVAKPAADAGPGPLPSETRVASAVGAGSRGSVEAQP
jgi:ectoine hydroxylase-related dioxygenase (phytanoyl-CoA dioxygenase family)